MIGQHRIGEREDGFRVEVILTIAFGAVGLREAVVDVAAAAAADPVQHAVDHTAAALVLVESIRLEIVDVAGRLRHGEAVGVLDAPGDRIDIARIVFGRVTKKRHEVTRRRQSDACDDRILCRVGELVNVAGLERCTRRQQPDCLLVDILPVTCRHGRRRVFQAPAYGQGGFRFVQRGGRVGQRVLRTASVVEVDVLVGRPGDARAVAVPGHRCGDGQLVAARRDVHVPAVRDDGVALEHEKAGTGVSRRDGVVDVAAVVQPVPSHRAPVVDVDEEPAVSFAEIDRLEHEDVHRVRHFAVGVPRRQLDVGDERVPRVGGVDFAIRLAPKLLVGTDVTERFTFQRGRFPARDFDLGDVRLGEGSGVEQQGGESEGGVHGTRPSANGCHDGPPQAKPFDRASRLTSARVNSTETQTDCPEDGAPRQRRRSPSSTLVSEFGPGASR